MVENAAGSWDIVVRPSPRGWQAEYGGRSWLCTIGRGGVTADKREGDGATPLGCWPLRRLHYRPDTGEAPRCALPARAIEPGDGWCDDPADPQYNRLVRLPHTASHEVLHRADDLYDLVVELGYNDDPPRAGRGSAIFLHVARSDYRPTEGCIAMAREDLVELLGLIGPDCRLCVRAA